MKRFALMVNLLGLVAIGFANGPDLLPNTPQDLPPGPGTNRLPIPTPTEGQLPPSDPADNDNGFEIVQAGEQERSGSHITLRNGAVAKFRGYTLSGDVIEGDERTQVYTITKGGRLEGRGVLLLARTITIDFRSRRYSYTDGDGTIPPSQLKGQTTDNVYLRGGAGASTQSRAELENSSFTTCDLDDPHYSLDARRTTIVYGRYALLRDVKFRVFNRTLLTLPFFYVPLSQEESRLTPEFGQTEDEGYYAKFKYFTPVRGDSFLITRLDLMSKLGQGFGQDYRYNTRLAQGALSVYGLLSATRTLTVNSLHTQPLLNGLLSVDGTYQRNNYLTAPDSVLLSTRAQLAAPLGAGNYRVSFLRNSSETAGFTSTNQNAALSHTGLWGRGFGTQLDLNFTENDTAQNGAVTNKSERLDTRFSATQKTTAFDAQVDYQRAIPVGSSNNFFTGADRTPQLTLVSDIGRLTSNHIPAPILGLRFEAGSLRDVTESPITRYLLQTDSRIVSRRGRFSFSTGGRFTQGLYSDDTAQYVLNYDQRIGYEYHDGSTFGVNYTRLQQFGYTPLAIDTTGRADNFQIDWQHLFSRSVRAGLTTGYDVYQASQSNTPWQSVGITASYDRGIRSRFNATFLYDTFNQAWSSARIDGTFRLAGAECAAGVRYDGLRSVWAGANLQVRGYRSGKVTADAFFGYNGYTSELEVQQYRFIYDLHCVEALLQVSDTKVGFRPGRTIGFYIRIKALPQTNSFGVGSRGQQYFGTGGAGY